MKPMKKYIRSLISFVVGIASLLQARSETIFIANHSFENPRFADGEYSVNAVPGWVGGGTWFHVANSPEYWFAGTSPASASPGPIDGLNIAGINTGAWMYQDLAAVVQPGGTYTLTMLTGHRSGVPFGTPTVSLNVGDQVLAQAIPSAPLDGVFASFELVYTAPESGPMIGQPLRIKLASTGGDAQPWFDNLKLTVFPDTSATVVVPTANQNAEGGAGSSVLNDNIRLQEVYHASQLPAGPITITGLRFRPSALSGGSFTATISNINIRLSTTQVTPQAISATFADNVGSNETVVFDGELALASAFTGAPGGPKDFDILVPFSTPFTYIPSHGNLLVDVRNFTGSSVTYVDAGAAANGTAGRVFAIGVEATVATGMDAGADIVQFIYTPIAASPVIMTQPVDQSVMLGSAATFNVNARSLVPLHYQWKHDGVEIANGTAAAFVITNAQLIDQGAYSVSVSNEFGVVVSTDAVLALTNPPPPSIIAQPAAITVLTGNVAVFSVVVSGVGPLTYEWSHNGVVIDAATNVSLVISNVSAAVAGNYQVAVANDFGSVTSAVATLTVTDRSNLIIHPRFADLEGGGGSGSLFQNIRLQEAYASSLFPQGPILITEIRFRPSGLYGSAFSATIADFQLNLSTFAGQPAQLGATFAANVGTDDTEVFHGPLSLSSSFTGPAGGPKDFDIIVPLTTPFLYDPSAGSLLVDIRNFSGGNISRVDAGAAPDNRIRRMFRVGASTATSGVGDNGADVLQISYSAALIPPYISSQPHSQHVVEGGTIALNVAAKGAAPLTYQWHFNGAPLADASSSSLVISNAQSAVAGDYLVVVGNGLGSITSQVAVVTVDSARTLSLIAPPERQEGSRISVLVDLESKGDVGGMTFLVKYDPNYLKEVSLNWTPQLEGLFNSVNYSPTGQVRATFALAGTPVPEGHTAVATIDFLLRSVPSDLSSVLRVEVIDASSPAGDPITVGNLTVNAPINIKERLIVGDNNANQRIDIGDVSVMLAMLTNFEQKRAWDELNNDLNSNGTLDSGDTIKGLRIAAGIDPQPGGAGGPSLAAAGGQGGGVLAPESVILSPASARVAAGQTITYQIMLRDIRTSIAGAVFTLDYPTNALRLVNAQSHRAGAMVPAQTLSIWNVAPAQNNFSTQNGHVTFAASSPGKWPASNGVLAEVTFTVQATASGQYLWPLTLRSSEVTPDGYANRQLVTVGGAFIGRDPLPGSIAGAGTSENGGFRFTAHGDPGASYRIESSTDLVHWLPVGQFLNSTGSHPFEEAIGDRQFRFYRVRPGSN